MTPVVNGTVRCPDCGDRLPTDRPAGTIAWVPCRACGTTVSARVHPLHPERAA